MPSSTSSATVSPRLNQISVGRSVGRFGSSVPSSAPPASAPSAGPPPEPVAGPSVPAPPPIRAGSRTATISSATTDSVRPETSSRLRSERPSCQASSSTVAMPATMPGTIGLNSSEGDTFSTVAARIVGPPQGRMLSTPFARLATTVSTTGLSPSRR